MQSPKIEEMLKIGWTADVPSIRRKQWNACYPSLKLVAYTNTPVSFARRVEGLIFAEIGTKRYAEECEKCHRTHREWFRYSLEDTARVVLRWAKWLTCLPYELDQPSQKLETLWQQHLNSAVKNKYVLAGNPFDESETWDDFTFLATGEGSEARRGR